MLRNPGFHHRTRQVAGKTQALPKGKTINRSRTKKRKLKREKEEEILVVHETETVHGKRD